MKLNDGDIIEHAWAEKVSGPGWSNHIIWVLIRNPNGRLRQECIQPSERTAPMAALHNISTVVSDEMTALVKAAAKKV